MEPWKHLGVSFNEWFYDKTIDKNWYWAQESNSRTCENYLWRLDNYIKGQSNEHILKSTFGKTNHIEIQKQLDWWFKRCLGANTKIYI
jgi:hypothetical protein